MLGAGAGAASGVGQSGVRCGRAVGYFGTPVVGPSQGPRAPPLPRATPASPSEARTRPRGRREAREEGSGAGKGRKGPGNPRGGHAAPCIGPGVLAPPRTGGRRPLPVPPRADSRGAFLCPGADSPTGSGRAFLGSACCWGMCHCGLPGPVRTGGPLKAPRCTCPGNALRGCPPRHPRCQKRPPRRFWHRLLRLTSILDGYVERAVIYVSCICPSTCARAPLWRSGLKRKDVAWGL